MNKYLKHVRAPEGWDPELWLALAPEVRGKVWEKLREAERGHGEKGEALSPFRRAVDEGRQLGPAQAARHSALAFADWQNAPQSAAASRLSAEALPAASALSRFSHPAGIRSEFPSGEARAAAPRAQNPDGLARGAGQGRVSGFPQSGNLGRSAFSAPSSFPEKEQALEALRRRGPEIRKNLDAFESQRTAQRVTGELNEAFEAVLPRIAALMGEGFERKAFKLEMARYLVEQGVPAEAVCAMSRGYELELCTKAMLFDKMMRRRADAEAKLADLPTVHSPRRAGREEGDKRARARAELNKNPNSTEALAALFAAM